MTTQETLTAIEAYHKRRDARIAAADAKKGAEHAELLKRIEAYKRRRAARLAAQGLKICPVSGKAVPLRADAEFNESEHPRNEKGMFISSSGGGVGSGGSKSFDTLMGKEYTGVKGQAAIDKLMQEKQGHVKDAFYHPEIGYIDIFWGDETAGLCHIIGQRRMRDINTTKFISEIGQTIERGKVGPDRNYPERENIFYKNNVVVITYELRGEETTAVLTAFRT